MKGRNIFTKEYIRHLLYEFNKDNNATESTRNIKTVYEDRTISVSVNGGSRNSEPETTA